MYSHLFRDNVRDTKIDIGITMCNIDPDLSMEQKGKLNTIRGT